MREIKFRCWDKKYNKMMFEGFHLFGEIMAFHQIEQYLFETKAVDGVPTIERWNDIEVMQFTGLKDKNGKEIYESDIIRTLHFRTESEVSYLFHKVVYDNERATFNAINLMNKDEFLTTNGNCFLYVALKDSTCEVVGNIYSNPELL